MKKLMFAAATVAVAGGAFSAPLVYDYKASVKHLYAKEISVRDQIRSQNLKVYQKIQKSSSLKGYLVVDADGATSQRIIAFDATYGNGNPATCGVDYGRSRAFLIVQNNGSLPASTRTPKVLPAVLDAKWIDTSFKHNSLGERTAKSGLAEGYLYVGGETVGAIRPPLDYDENTDTIVEGAAFALPGAGAAGVASVQDYLWTSIYLFGGQYNGPKYGLGAAYVATAEAAIDGNFEAGVQVGGITGYAWYFHDAWLNGAGIGKYIADDTTESCCGLVNGGQSIGLSSLSGNLKGGLFLCTDEGVTGNYTKLAFTDWEEQFFAARLIPSGAFGGAGTDVEQFDTWLDGSRELNTTDVISGSWAIKLRTKNVPNSALSEADVKILFPGTAGGIVEDAKGIQNLVETIKGCILATNSKAVWLSSQEIPTLVKNHSMKDIPAMTTRFATYYGLANFQ